MGMITRSVDADMLDNVITGYEKTLNMAREALRDYLQTIYGTHDAMVPDAILDGKRIGRDDDGSGSHNYDLYCFGWLIGKLLQADSK